MILESLQEALKNKFDTELREGVHVSDLTLCQRQAANKRLNPKPLTMRELNYFTSGRGIGDALAILTKSNSEKFIPEYEVKYSNIVAHGVFFDSNLNWLCRTCPLKEKCAEYIKCECGKEVLKKELETHVAEAHFTNSEERRL